MKVFDGAKMRAIPCYPPHAKADTSFETID